MQIEFPDLKGKEKNTLFIIGNGFDLYHFVLSKYKHFCCWLNLNGYEAFVNDMERIFPDLDNKQISLWHNFEEALENYSLNDLYKRLHKPNNDIFNPDRWYKEAREEIGKTVEQIRPLMKEWVKHINISKVEPILNLSKESSYLTFNYTKILEDIYKIPQQNVYHIHGSVDDEEVVTGFNGTKNPDDHDAPTDEEIYVERGYLEALNKLDKDINGQWKKICKHFSSLNDVSCVVVLGHSFGKIDLWYLYRIAKSVKSDAHWHFSKHTEQDEEHINEFLRICKKERYLNNQVIRWIFNF